MKAGFPENQLEVGTTRITHDAIVTSRIVIFTHFSTVNVGNSQPFQPFWMPKPCMHPGWGFQGGRCDPLNEKWGPGYKIVGSHSAVKLCRWTKHQLRGWFQSDWMGCFFWGEKCQTLNGWICLRILPHIFVLVVFQ